MNSRIHRHRFPVLASALLAAAVLIGFARTYYLRVWFDLPPLTRMAHVHGALWTLWLALHYTQARLVAAHRVVWHRRLGIAGAVLGAVLVVSSAGLAIAGAVAGHAPPGRQPLQFLSVSLGATVVFGAFLTAALAMRRRREWHSRLMLLASLVLILPAIGRLDTLLLLHFGTPRAILPFLVTLAFIVWMWVEDRRCRGAIHPAALYGGVLLLVSIPLRQWIGHWDAWMPFARWLTS